MLRKIFFLTVFVLDTIVIASLVVCLSYFPRTNRLRRKLEEYWARIAVSAAGLRLHTDLPSLNKGNNYIFVCNHQSHLDTPILLSLLRDFHPRFLAKDSLFKIPFLGPGMYRTGHLSVARENPCQGIRDLQRAAERANQGESLLVFPEGTRSETGKLQDFYTGVFIIALKSAGASIVPLALKGTLEILPKGTISLGKGRDVYISGRAPLDIHQNYGLKERERLKEDLYNSINEMYSELIQCREQKRD